jgi:peroxiredoxin
VTVRNGDRAPDFALQDQHGQTVSLASFRGERAVALMFYPYAFSGVCSGELAAVRDNLPRFERHHAAVLAVSCDPMFALRAFADRDRLELPLLSDFWPHGAVAQAYDVFDAKRGCARRSTFVVDRDGVVRWQVHNALPDARDVAEQLAALKDLAV